METFDRTAWSSASTCSLAWNADTTPTQSASLLIFTLANDRSDFHKIDGVRDSPYQHLAQAARAFPIDKLLGPAQLHIHVTVHADQPALVFRLAPFQPYDDFFVDSVTAQDVSEPDGKPGGTRGSRARPWSVGRGRCETLLVCS